MVPDHADDDRRQLDSLEDRDRHQRVASHRLPLVGVQRSRLGQHGIGHADLADVVEQGPVLDLATGRVVQPERAGDAHRVLRDAGGVARGVGILGVDRLGEAADELQVAAREGGEQAAVLTEQRLERLVLRAQLLDHPFGRAEVLAGCDEHGRGGHREHEDPQESEALVREHDAGGQNAVDHVMRREPGGGLPEDGERTSPLGDGRRGDDERDVDDVVGETCQRADAEQREPADAVPGGRVQERAPRDAGQGVRRHCCTPCRS